jgi:pyruvate/2-oxoglutarate dehydrogenase complex dihydrolipoamide acyltransferase (E2) component
MTKPILMPKLGLTMTEGEIVEWKVAPGDRVEVGDVIFVIETDKSANDVEALDAGTIEALLVSEGDVVEVGAVVATLSEG